MSNGNGEARALATWSAVACFFGNLAAYKALGLIAGGDVRLGLSALLTAAVVSGAVYAKIRRDAAARRQPTTLAEPKAPDGP